MKLDVSQKVIAKATRLIQAGDIEELPTGGFRVRASDPRYWHLTLAAPEGMTLHRWTCSCEWGQRHAHDTEAQPCAHALAAMYLVAQKAKVSA